MKVTPVIMAGGAGTRLWPMSRSLYPKQFLSLIEETTMLQDTYSRLNGLGFDASRVICGEEHRFTVAEQLRTSGVKNAEIILEPEGRNTAPAIALAAFQSQEGNAEKSNQSETLLLVLPADHVISDVAAFQAAVKRAAKFASQGKLVTFGIVPYSPETGYGYIRRGSPLDDAFEVAQFVEKPDLATAENFLSTGKYLWNSGMFLFDAATYLEELKRQRPEIYEACRQSMANQHQDMDFIRPDKQSFIACPSDSIDYAVMEGTERAVVVPVDCGWSDVGSWSSLWDVSRKDENGNFTHGDVMTEATQNTYIRSDRSLIAAVGVSDLIIVETDDAIMVSQRDRAQDVKAIVEKLKARGRSEAKLHRKVFRPWGHYDSIDSGDRFQVKRIVVNPGCKLSLQMHHHRAEHWIVVRGTAKVTRDDEVLLLSENESTYIPLGTKHRLENPGTIPLEIIEVQSGSYLGEDDIIRFDDTYGRR